MIPFSAQQQAVESTSLFTTVIGGHRGCGLTATLFMAALKACERPNTRAVIFDDNTGSLFSTFAYTHYDDVKDLIQIVRPGECMVRFINGSSLHFVGTDESSLNKVRGCEFHFIGLDNYTPRKTDAVSVAYGKLQGRPIKDLRMILTIRGQDYVDIMSGNDDELVAVRGQLLSYIHGSGTAVRLDAGEVTI